MFGRKCSLLCESLAELLEHAATMHSGRVRFEFVTLSCNRGRCPTDEISFRLEKDLIFKDDAVREVQKQMLDAAGQNTRSAEQGVEWLKALKQTREMHTDPAPKDTR